MGSVTRFPRPPVRPRPAATVLALRPCATGLEVLMVRRAAASEFMGNSFVFPGGSVDDCDRGATAAGAIRWEGDAEEMPWRAAALRELAEEAGLALTDPPGVTVSGSGAGVYEATMAAGARLDAHRLHPLSRWITPEGLPRRFDTRFYAADASAESLQAEADGVEVFEASWVEPDEALRRSQLGEWEIPFPTLNHIEVLRRLGSVQAVLDYSGSLGEITGVLPRIVLGENGGYSVRLPGEPGYDPEGSR